MLPFPANELVTFHYSWNCLLIGWHLNSFSSRVKHMNYWLWCTMIASKMWYLFMIKELLCQWRIHHGRHFVKILWSTLRRLLKSSNHTLLIWFHVVCCFSDMGWYHTSLLAGSSGFMRFTLGNCVRNWGIPFLRHFHTTTKPWCWIQLQSTLFTGFMHHAWSYFTLKGNRILKLYRFV